MQTYQVPQEQLNQSAKLANDVQLFLNNGSKITFVKTGISSDPLLSLHDKKRAAKKYRDDLKAQKTKGTK
mgnify:CR=1 FL=1